MDFYTGIDSGAVSALFKGKIHEEELPKLTQLSTYDLFVEFFSRFSNEEIQDILTDHRYKFLPQEGKQYWNEFKKFGPIYDALCLIDGTPLEIILADADFYRMGKIARVQYKIETKTHQTGVSPGRMPEKKRVEEIHRDLVSNWPNEKLFRPCPENKVTCDGCSKPSGKNEAVTIGPCAFDIAHFAAHYEAREKFFSHIINERKKVGNKLKCSRNRLPEGDDLKSALGAPKPPKGLRTFGMHRHETKRLGEIKGYFTDGKDRAENRELAQFIFIVDRFLKAFSARVRDGIIIEAVKALKPRRKISEDIISKTRMRYRHLRK